MRDLMTRRSFAKFFMVATGTAVAPVRMEGAIAVSVVTTSDVSAKTRAARAAGDDNLQSEFLLDLVFDSANQ